MTGLVSKKEKGQGREKRACSVLATGKISLEWKLNEHRFLFFASFCVSFKRDGLRGKGSNGYATSQSPSTSHMCHLQQ